MPSPAAVRGGEGIRAIPRHRHHDACWLWLNVCLWPPTAAAATRVPVAMQVLRGTPRLDPYCRTLFPHFGASQIHPNFVPGGNGNIFARRAPHVLPKSVSASWPAKGHFGTIWEHRREHPSLTLNFKTPFLSKLNPVPAVGVDAAVHVAVDAAVFVGSARASDFVMLVVAGVVAGFLGGAGCDACAIPHIPHRDC